MYYLVSRCPQGFSDDRQQAQMDHLNYVILAMVTGAILLASVYHSVLFAHNRLRLIGYYTVYLWAAFAYCLMRCMYYNNLPDGKYLTPDETMQMISFALYIRFTRVAMELHPAHDRLAVWFCKMAPYVIGIYLVLYNTLNREHTYVLAGSLVPAVLYLCIRAYLLFVGFAALIVVIKKRRDVYFRYIFYAIFTVIFTGFSATLIEIFWKRISPITALSVLTIGYAIDVCFFSAAISYKMRRETIGKEIADRRVLEQELELQRNKMDSLVLSFKVKEEERSRIATELHDEIGATLSSISILSDVILKEQSETNVHSMQQEIRESSKLMMEKMDDIIFSLNPRNDSMEKMLLRIRQFATPLFEAKDIDYEFMIDRRLFDVPMPMELRQQAYLIAKEAVNNLIKHSGATVACFSASWINATLIFKITDNGKGFDTAAGYAGNGLLNMQHRAEKMGAELQFHSAPFEETSVTLHVKIG